MANAIDKITFEKAFSERRMEKYFRHYDSEIQSIKCYQNNIELSESFYPCIAVFEVLLRNAINRELIRLFGREDWYAVFAATPGLIDLNKYISQANRQIANRKEQATPSKMVAELTLGFWVTLFNVEYERVLWKDLRRVFPNMPKKERQRKKVAPPLNRFRTFRNRIFHHEPIVWNLVRLRAIHTEIITVIEWINKDVAHWLASFDRFENVCQKTEMKDLAK
ncbi:MAG: hypothetical protein LBH32_01580 [Dysgonamonadaceae bacterium]|jgi:hypothetical protein|nr:hypothetical protein [Dysgonamonadaceae bacterium]